MLARRELLGLAGRAGVVGICVALVGCRSEDADEGQARPLAPDAVAAIIAVGHAYLSAVPGDADADGLRRDLGLDGGRTISAVDLGLDLQAAVRDDYALGRVIVLDGWMLSLTETRAAALVALERAG